MRSNATRAIWLALFMLLLVAAAAVYFLNQRNSQLETELQLASQEAEAAQGASVAAEATRDRLSSDLSVRQAALDSAAATRDTLEVEAELGAGRAQELESTLALQAGSLADARATLQALALQAAIIAPADGATITPLQQVDIIGTARGESGLDLVSLTVDGQQIAQVPAEGRATINVRAGWSPPDEGDYTIGIEATAADGRSETTAITVTAAFASDEAREIALRDQLEQAAIAERFPAPEATVETQMVAEATDAETGSARLHRLLLTGRQEDDDQAIADEAFSLSALDLIDSEDAYQAYLDDVVTADLLAYYDPESGALTDYLPGNQTGAFGRWQAMHDLAHQWQSERLGLDELDLAAMDGDQRLAARSVIEGDAAFLQYRLLAGEVLPAQQADEVGAGLAAAASDATASLPLPLQATFEFAYRHGVPFVQALYDQGGFAQVDDAWRALPVSSEQILHPDLYLAQDSPRQVTLAPLGGSFGRAWHLVQEDVFGEFLLRQHLGVQQLTAVQIDLAASGWGGGQYAVYRQEGSNLPLVLIRLAWDSQDDAAEFSDVYVAYLISRYGDEEITLAGDDRCWRGSDVGCLFQVGDDSLVIRAPNLELALAAADLQRNAIQP